MSNISQKILKGKILIASLATLTDKPFNRAIILITEHNEEGTVGMIMNKPDIFTVGDLVKDFSCTFPVYIGGPVERDHLYFLHKVPDLIPDSVHIAGNLYWGGDYDAVKTLIEKNLIKQSEIRFFSGYSGWSPGQLEAELELDTWVLTENDFPDIFKIKDASGWKQKLLELGGEYQIWANSPDDPNWN